VRKDAVRLLDLLPVNGNLTATQHTSNRNLAN
jgi:hypothetical protein